MGYKHEFNSSSLEDIVIPPPPGAVTGANSPVKAGLEIGSIQHQVKEIVRQQSYQQVFDVNVFRCTCQRCPKIWITLQQTPPKTCPACKSAWWQVRPSGHMARTEEGPNRRGGRKKTKLRLKADWVGRGRPPKHAYEEVGADGKVISAPMEYREDLPEVPMELLGTLDTVEVAPDPGDRGTAVFDDEAFPVPTPFNNPTFIPYAPVDAGDPEVQTGQPTDDGGSPEPSSEVLPPPAMDPTFDEDDWQRFGD